MASRYIGFRNEAETLRSKFLKRIQTIFSFVFLLFTAFLQIP